MKHTYRLLADRHQWIVQRLKPEHEAKDGKTIPDKWANLGYYPNLEAAALALLEKTTRDDQTSGAKAIVGSLNRAKKEVLRAVWDAHARVEAEGE